jgi:hypothetical protein
MGDVVRIAILDDREIDTSVVGRIRSINDANTDIHGISLGW